jgi:hypothetical protein
MVDTDTTRSIDADGRQRRRNYLIRNQTPHELVLIGRTDVNGKTLVLRLSPLQRRLIGGHPVKLLQDAAGFAQLDHAIDWEAEPSREARMLASAWLTGVGSAGLLAGLAIWWFGGNWWAAFGGFAFLLLCMVSLSAAWHFLGPSNDDGLLRTEMDPTPVHGDWWELLRDVGISAVEGLVGLLLILVAVVGPAIAIYYGTEVHAVIKLTHWNRWRLVGGSSQQYILVARSLQLILLILMSVLPALMFFQFDREKLSTLVDRWLHAVFRLDPSLQTVADVDAKYGRRVEEFFGASLAVGEQTTQRRLRNRTPVVVATLLIAIGWIVVLINTSLAGSTSAGPNPAHASFQRLFVPEATPLTMAFLGSYFLCVQVALRGYVRGDLKPKTYNLLTVRILMAVILAWALQALFGTHPTTLALSFLAGIIPNTVLLVIRDVGARSSRSLVDLVQRASASLADTDQFAPPDEQGSSADDSDELSSRSPLTQLDEIDVYERTRLEEEGITCVQALARHDLIDLMLSSRIPVPRLIDWLDQALLYQHVAPKVAALHRLGIRSATDFLQLWTLSRLSRQDATGKSLATALAEALSGDPAMLAGVLDDDEWMAYVHNWRTHDGSDAGPVTVYDTAGRATKWPRKDDRSSPSTYELIHPRILEIHEVFVAR